MAHRKSFATLVSWKQLKVEQARITAMTILVLLTLIVTLALVAPRYGADTRRLDTDTAQRDSLWSRTLNS